MRKLFDRCLNATYTETPQNGDYAIEVEGDTLYLLFQWSRGIEDWKSNFNFPAKPYKGMDCVWFCHRGFRNVWKGMRDEVEAKVKEMLFKFPKVKRIICVGYSHGGAISLFATEDMAYLYGNMLNVIGYGFGAPRVVWGIVPKPVKNRLQCFRAVRNIPDLVTHVPPVLFGFRHVASPFKIGRRKGLLRFIPKYTPIRAHFQSAYETETENYKF